MSIAAYFKIPIETLKKECDPKKRVRPGLDIGRLRDSRPEAPTDTLKNELTPRRAMRWPMGFGAGKASANRARSSLLSYSVQTDEIASTDTRSDVSVAV